MPAKWSAQLEFECLVKPGNCNLRKYWHTCTIMIASIFRPLPGETRIGTRSAVIVIIVFVIVIVDVGLDANMMLIRLVISMWSCICFPLYPDAMETIFS